MSVVMQPNLRPDAAARSARPSIPAIVALHAEETEHLWHVRTRLVDASDVGLSELARHDERIAAHLDGLVVAGVDGVRIARESLAPSGRTNVALALLNRDTEAWDEAVAAARAAPALVPELVAAIAWVPSSALRGIVAHLLAAGDAFDRGLGLIACTLHDVDTGRALDEALVDAVPELRVTALRSIARRGLVAYRGRCVSASAPADATCRVEEARTAVLLGDRGEGLERFHALALAGDRSASSLLLKVIGPERVREVLSAWFRAGVSERALIRGVGIAGDASHLDWLVERMRVRTTARIAAEAFVMITGVDLVRGRMSVAQPEGAVTGPSDDPTDDDVALDEDDGLPWPDADAVADWWLRHRSAFVPGRRWFLGREPEPTHLRTVLVSGNQRQRRHAAEHLCLARPGTPLFDVSAPASRQRERLAR